jgi:hypothetical protein
MSEKKNNPFSPICLRVSPEEKARLEHDAGNMTLSAYIREKVLGEKVAPRKRRMIRPVKDHTIIAQLFALIKQTQSWNNLNQIAKAINSNTWMVSPESEKALQEACKAIIEIRSMLMKALGLGGSDRP